ncbi:MAG: glycosyltransferase [Gammaproteobacteria bacterium]|nr:MAG: glycosyltransferase [Gammaproteobacteria bacterium]
MIISLVCPVYNERESIIPFIDRISTILSSYKFELVFVNDGSTDDTLSVLKSIKKTFNRDMLIVDLSRNFGKEAALSAGLAYAKGDAVIPIDVDLQDPPEIIPELINKMGEGYDMVLAKRSDRSSDGYLKRIGANLYYKVHNLLADTKIPDNVGDYRLMTRKVVEAINNLPENQRFMKGLFAWVGFSTAKVEYQRAQRVSGTASFSGRKLLGLAINGITGFSTIPLRMWLYIGSVVSMLSFMYGLYIVLRTVIYGVDVPGYASLLTAILFVGGVQLMGLGILGEYLGRVFLESKRRPVYIVDNVY